MVRPFILLVFLPCKERRSEDAKRLLVQLQTLLRQGRRQSHATKRDYFKIVSVFGCSGGMTPEEYVASMDPRTLLGVLSFQPK